MNYEVLKKQENDRIQDRWSDDESLIPLKNAKRFSEVQVGEPQQNKSNCMFPSSFYCMRQQLNTKKRNNSYNNSRTHSQSVEEPLSIMIKQFYKW